MRRSINDRFSFLLILLSFVSLPVFAQSSDCNPGGNVDQPYGGPGNEPFLPDWSIPMIRSKDPNDIQGPNGVGPKRWVSTKETIAYTIRFENDAQFADAPAQRVAIRCPIHSKLDINSVRLSSLGFSKLNFTVPANLSTYTKVLQTADSLGVNVNVFAGIDVVNKEVFWLLTALDPSTGLPVTDAAKGFLPVNDTVTTGVGRGEGFVTYSVVPKATAQTADTVGAQASIVFDVNGPLLTNREVHTLDALPPTSRVVQLLTVSARRFNLSFFGQDDPGGVGLQDYDLYMWEDNDSVRLAASHLTGSQYPFVGKPGSTYRFFTLARDSVGNLESFKRAPDATTIISLDTLNRPPSIVKSGLSVSRLDTAVCASRAMSVCFSVMDPDSNLAMVSVGRAGSKGTASVSPSGNGFCLSYTALVSSSGKDSVLVLACDSAGACDSLLIHIQIRGITPATLTPANDTALCPGAVTLLTSNAGTNLIYAWFRNDTLINGASNRTLIVNRPGTYYVRLTDSCGIDTSDHIQIQYQDFVRPVVSAIANPVCQGQATTLSTVPQAGTRYEWSRNDTLLVGANSPALSASVAGNYQVTAFRGLCRQRSDSFLFRLTPIPATPTIVANGPTELPSGGTVRLSAPAGFAYLWSNGATTQDITVSAAGRYSVQTIANACTSAASAPTIITIQVCGPTPIITVNGSTHLCPGQSVGLISSAPTGNLWSVNNVTYRSIVVNSSGTITVRQIIGACTTAASAPVVITKEFSSPPSIYPSASPVLCGGSSITLTSSNPASSNVWSTGATTPSITVSTPGSYTVRSFSASCSSAVSSPLVVTEQSSPPPPTITVNGSTTLCPGQNVGLVSSALTGNLWSINNLTYRSIVVNFSRTFTVRQIVGACTTAASAPVTVTKLPSCPGPLPPSQVRSGEETEAVLDIGPGIKLFPNPVVGGSFTIASEEALSKVRILTVTGVLVFSQELSGYSADLRASLNTGTYVVEITSGSQVVRKLVSWE